MKPKDYLVNRHIIIFLWKIYTNILSLYRNGWVNLLWSIVSFCRLNPPISHWRNKRFVEKKPECSTEQIERRNGTSSKVLFIFLSMLIEKSSFTLISIKQETVRQSWTRRAWKQTGCSSSFQLFVRPCASPHRHGEGSKGSRESLLMLVENSRTVPQLQHIKYILRMFS